MEHSQPEERELLVQEILGTKDNCPLLTMMKDQYANYVVQKVIIDIVNDQQRDLIISRIKPHIPQLKKYTYGKHIINRIEKYIN